MCLTQRPAEEAIAKVIADTGMDRVQAYHHVQQRQLLQAQLAVGSPARRVEMILGKSALDSR